MVCLCRPGLEWGLQPPFEMSWWSSGPGASVLLLKRRLWWAQGPPAARHGGAEPLEEMNHLAAGGQSYGEVHGGAASGLA